MLESIYYKKYIKYKKKYSYYKLLNNTKIITGGFILNDNHENTFKTQILKTLEQHSDTFKILPDLVYNIIKQFTDESYCKLYEDFIKIYLNDKTYTQVFTKKNGENISKFPCMHNYHICFASLIFINYMIELEIFTLIHNSIIVNTLDNPGNNLSTIFPDSLTRTYRPEVMNSNINDKITSLCVELDNLFYDFMNDFVKKCFSINNSITIEQIYECIIPIEHKDHNNSTYDNTNNKIFDFIYVDWKDRLRKLSTVFEGTKINELLENAINNLSDQNNIYVAEGLGFFSYMNMISRTNPKMKYGSCITFTLFELYIMSRLHIPANTMYLIIEASVNDKKHKFWNLSQTKSDSPILSHWATEFKFNSKTIKFRSAVYKRSSYIEKNRINFQGNVNKVQILKLLTYPILDSYITYLEQNRTKIKENVFEKIYKFIKSRLFLIESIVIVYCSGNIKKKSDLLNDILYEESTNIYSSDFIKNIALSNILNDSDNTLIKLLFNSIEIEISLSNISNIKNLLTSNSIMTLLKTRPEFINIINNKFTMYNEHPLLYYFSANGNIEIVKIMLDLPGININVKNVNNLTPYCGAATGFENYSETNNQRLDIILLLIEKGADRISKCEYRGFTSEQIEKYIRHLY
jgi:hypothetical protein